MVIQALEADDADMDRIFEVASLAFARNEPLWDVFWPQHWESEGRRAGAERMRETRNTDPNTKYIKAVDTETGVIMGMSKWNIYANNTLPDMEKIQYIKNFWKDDEELAFATSLTELFTKERNEAIRASGGNLVSLDIAAVDPGYGRRGVGSVMVKWGTDKADELGVDAVVESSPQGKGLYAKHGYVFQKDCHYSVPGPYEHIKGSAAWMVRPKKQ